jgi:hypothetical protein
MFTTLEKIAQGDPKTADIVLIENYAAFQNRLLFFVSQNLVNFLASSIDLCVLLLCHFIARTV